MKTHRVMTADQAQRLAGMITGLPLPFTVTVTEGDIKRTIQQNALLHQWYGQVAKQHGDCTMVDVKGWSHHKWGLPIKLRNPQFAWVWKQSGEKLNYEQQCALLASGVLNISSSMNVSELSEYMGAMQLHYRGEGVHLTDPDAMRYEGQAA